MYGRALAIASGLLVTVTSTALIGTATAAAIGATEAHHPTAAGRHGESRRFVGHPAGLPLVDAAATAQHERVVRARFVEAVNTARFFEAAAAAERARTDAARAAPASARASANSGSDVLECIKHRESRGEYDVVNPSSGAAGAYQFMPGTWDTTARSAGRIDLVGVNPADASPADQDAMARQLLATQGLGPWGGSCG